jgi:hypothetical protein
MNRLPYSEMTDTIHWEIPDNWTITPPTMPIAVAQSASHKVEFEAICNGPLYPLPKARLQVEFAEGKQAIINDPIRVARTISCQRASMPPSIDGNIAEPIWKNPENRLFAADGKVAATDPVDFFFAYDDENLYIAARCNDPVMDSLRASVVDHDGPIYSEDCVGLFIQPDIEKNTAYQIYFNPLGFAFDQKLVMNQNGYMDADRAWDGNYNVMTVHGPDFWAVEAAIPLDQLGGAGAPGKKIGLNFRRKQARMGATANWQAPIDYNPETFGVLIME